MKPFYVRKVIVHLDGITTDTYMRIEDVEEGEEIIKEFLKENGDDKDHAICYGVILYGEDNVITSSLKVNM